MNFPTHVERFQVSKSVDACDFLGDWQTSVRKLMSSIKFF